MFFAYPPQRRWLGVLVYSLRSPYGPACGCYSATLRFALTASPFWQSPQKEPKGLAPPYGPPAAGSLTPSLLRGPAAKGHPWPITALAASMPLNPLHNDCVRPAGKGRCPGSNLLFRRGKVLAFVSNVRSHAERGNDQNEPWDAVGRSDAQRLASADGSQASCRSGLGREAVVTALVSLRSDAVARGGRV
ncbi:hypothetical protein FBY03_10347 [Pseudomonas sp. SJZ079]|nr:hypothetical protein FBY03_10347 [Pseudomonas sp. SJZ079]